MKKFTDLLNCLLTIIKKYRPIDIIIVLGILIALIVGFCTYTKIRQTADKQIEATSNIRFQVYIRGITLTSNDIPLKKGEMTFITIRNVPYSDLKVIDVLADRKKIVIPAFNSTKTIIVEDAAQANLYDVVVTLEDVAKITKDGAVVGGNKIKIGLPIMLEGEDYKFSGIVSDLKLVPDEHEIINNQNTTYDIQ